MKKGYIYIIMFACAMAITGCSASQEEGAPTPLPDTGSGTPITFATNLDSDVWQDQPTRSTTGVISDLKTIPEGFGVIAYLTDDQKWSTAINGIVDFTTCTTSP